VQGGPLGALGVFRADQVAVLFLVLIGLLAVAVSVATVGWMRQEIARGQMHVERLRYYYALVHGFLATMLVTVLADNLGILWIAMEGTTITSALLVGFSRRQARSGGGLEVHHRDTIGISFGLFGTVLVYGAAAHAQGGVLAGAMNWSSIVANRAPARPRDHPHRLHLRDRGLRTKAGLAPVHMWLPDAHSQAPTPCQPCCQARSSSARSLGSSVSTPSRAPPAAPNSARAATDLRLGVGAGGDSVHPCPARPQAPAWLSQRRAMSGSSRSDSVLADGSAPTGRFCT